jgi:hypothetical protein
MTRVQYRMAAARFFLATLVRRKPQPPEFDWLLEAFINHARSVGWLMVAECRHQEILREWQAHNPPAGEVEELFKKLTDARIRITKREPARTTQFLELKVHVPPELIDEFEASNALDKGDLMIVDGPFAGPVTVRTKDGRYTFTADVQQVYQTLDEFPNLDILDVGERYMQHLESRYSAWLKHYQSTHRKQPNAPNL